MPEVVIPSCQHIKPNGVPCGSPALRTKKFCYFHDPGRGSFTRSARARGFRTLEEMTEFPILEDAISIQFALMQILRELLRNKLNPKTASLMLFALQIACMNKRDMRAERRAEAK
ncbi:MAG TPA: hypothetical protein VFA76_16950 [Terriglobales bacterium]|nr:hypothetical protein [Terriglobales bacterium]